MTKLKLLTIISDDRYERKIKEIYKKNNVSFKLLTHGNGTASPSLLDYFGLIETKKDIHLSLIPDYLEGKILKQIYNSLNMNNLGTGIAFTISLSSANKFLVDGLEDKITYEEEIMNKEKHHLIITIVLEGYLEQAISAAKKVGAPGGTVIRGRGLGNEEAVKLFGFEIEPGRELILNVVSDEIKNAVMEEITKTVGIKTPSRGICISIPVDNVIGIGKDILTTN